MTSRQQYFATDLIESEGILYLLNRPFSNVQTVSWQFWVIFRMYDKVLEQIPSFHSLFVITNNRSNAAASTELKSKSRKVAFCPRKFSQGGKKSLNGSTVSTDEILIQKSNYKILATFHRNFPVEKRPFFDLMASSSNFRKMISIFLYSFEQEMGVLSATRLTGTFSSSYVGHRLGWRRQIFSFKKKTKQVKVISPPILVTQLN